jgi:glycosyltransferase involved in cell wall biosynthesis
MRILLVHNFYGSSAPSGENRVVLEERDMLRAAGHEVIEHFAYSDAVRDRGLLRLLKTAVRVPWNQDERARLRRRVQELQPEIVHIHNVFPLFSPAIFGAAAGNSAAVVHTLHNYRAFCPSALVLRDNKICTDCIDRESTLPALRYGCYRDSRLATAPLAACVSLHRRLGTYRNHVDAFIAFTEFQKSQLCRAGFPQERIHVKPNCLPSKVKPVPWEQREQKCVFVGRISREKGVDVLLDAWSKWGDSAPQLEIVGGGPELDELRRCLPGTLAGRVSFRGSLSSDETQHLLSRAKLLVIPSVWYEGFPLVFREATGYGVPVAASRIGALTELIGTRGVGRLFEPGDPESLFRLVSSFWRDDAALRQASDAAICEASDRYSPRTNLAALQSVYTRAVDSKKQRLHTKGGECRSNAMS